MVFSSQKLQNKYFSFFIFTLVGLIIYSGSLNSPLLFDDKHVLPIANQTTFFEHLLFLLSYQSRALVMLSFKINLLPESYDLFFIRITNICIHIINACLAYCIITKLSEDKYKKWHLPFWGGLIFVCHPALMQGVVYISQRFTSLCCLFYFLSILIFLNIRQNKQRNKTSFIILYIFLLVCIHFSNLSKEIAITLPLTLLLLEFLFFRNMSLKNSFLFFLPLLLIGFLPLILRLFPTIPLSDYGFTRQGLIDSSNHTKTGYLATEIPVIFKYLITLTIPHSLHFLRGDFVYYKTFFHVPVMLVLFFHLSFIFYGISRYKKSPLVCFCILFFYLALAPESSFLPLEWPMFEYRMYLPSLGFCILFPYAINNFVGSFKSKIITQPRKVSSFILTIYFLFLSLSCQQQVHLYQNELNLWKNSVLLSPNLYVSQGQLGAAYFRENDFNNAAIAFKTALQIENKAIRHARGLAMSLVRMGHIEEGLSLFKKYNFDSHIFPEELYQIGEAYRKKNQCQKAVPYYQKALKTIYSPQANRALIECLNNTTNK